MKLLITALFLGLLSGCLGGLPGVPISYNDGTWSKCQYEKAGTKFWVPVQNAPPIGTEQPDGTVIKCEPIPKSSLE